MEIQDDVGQRTMSLRARYSDPPAGMQVPAMVDEFNSTTGWESLVQLVLQRAVRETRSDRGVVSWIDGNEMIVAGCHDPFGELVEIGSRWPLAGDEVSAVALAAGRPEVGIFGTLDLEDGPAEAREVHGGLKHLLVAPVVAGGEDIAILCVSRRRSEGFTSADSEILDVIAAVAAQPLRAARLDNLLNAALAELSDRLVGAESVERVKTDVLRLASHELRTPLTVLHGYLALIRAGHFGDIPGPLDHIMKILERRTEEMNGLVNDMLVAARVDDAPTDIDRETVDLRALLGEAVRAVAPRATAQHRLRVHLPQGPVYVRVDSERLVLAVRNIIDNAVKYSPLGGEVICCLSESDGTVTIRIADRGLGIAVDDRQKLFTRFGRVLTSANSHIPGIGLGLYFSREVARRHGGDVELIEHDGPGCIFELTLPLAGVRDGATPAASVG